MTEPALPQPLVVVPSTDKKPKAFTVVDGKQDMHAFLGQSPRTTTSSSSTRPRSS